MERIKMGDLKNQKGMALVLFLAILLMLTLVGVVAIMNSSNNLDVSGNKMNSNKTLYAADQGLEKAISRIRVWHDTSATPMTGANLPSGTFSSGGATVTYSTKNDTFPVWFVTEDGAINYQPYQGLKARKIYYLVTSQATSSDGRYRSRVSAKVVANMVRLFTFDAFYDGDLEFSSEQAYAADTHFQHIHSNSNIYLEQPTTPSANTLRFRSGVTAGGNIYHGHNTTYSGSPTKSGKVLIRSGVATYDTLNISTANWVDSSLIRWHGAVEDSRHGIHQTKLRVVRPYNTNPIDWIARATAKPTMSLERDGVCGFKVDTDPLTGGGIANRWNGTSWGANVFHSGTPSATTIAGVGYDFREKLPLTLISINLAQLNTNGFWPIAGTRVIYATQSRPTSVRRRAIRIWNAALLASDLIIASNLPVYIQGNFNTVNPRRAAIIADAVTAISDTSPTLFTAWISITPDSMRTVIRNGATSGGGTYDMTINACIVTGNKPTSSSQFSGGVNNLVRLLQNWNNDTLIIQGPQICLWSNSVDTGSYQFPTTYYDDPLLRQIESDITIGDSTVALPTRYPPFPDNGPYVSYIEVLNRTIMEIP
ncbi:MAG: pilus assembly PilX N-terminal domain-containing protein [candidate division Zixibacteria bacterium]|nr:pilus assembly PilX N-terminal domain-containing protein [candidate division Zixibacteria bacterium]